MPQYIHCIYPSTHLIKIYVLGISNFNVLTTKLQYLPAHLDEGFALLAHLKRFCVSDGGHQYTLNVWSQGKQFFFSRVLMFPEVKSKETSGLEGKQN